MLRTMRSSGVIHLFALLHALVVLVCQWVGVDDALTLTIFTMTMTVILCLKKGMPIHMYCADTAEDVELCISLGADLITANDPVPLMKRLGRLG